MTVKKTICFSLLLSMIFSLDVESGGKLSTEQLAIDVKHYGINIRVDPYKKTIMGKVDIKFELLENCLLYTSPSPRDQRGSRMPSSA